jgi:vanillate/3-O-methylgallate O-demethylase
VSNYAASNYDSILSGGKVVGLSMFTGYTHNERKVLSLATVDHDLPIGANVTVVWGEPGGGSAKASVERPHRQFEVRATVAPAPYTKEVREHYHEGWRSAEA